MVPITKTAERYDVLKYFDDDGKFKPTSFSIPNIKKFHETIRLYYGQFNYVIESCNEIASYDTFLNFKPNMTLKEYNMVISFYCDPRIQKIISDIENHPDYTKIECKCCVF